MDQVGIDFEWQRGAQLNQGKRASSTIRFAMIPLLLHATKRLSFRIDYTKLNRTVNLYSPVCH